MNLKLLKEACYLIKSASYTSNNEKRAASNPGVPSNPFLTPPGESQDQDPWAMPGVQDNGYLDVPFNYDVPAKNKTESASKIFPDYVDSGGPDEHYYINNSNQIYDLAMVSRYYDGIPLTFTDPNGGHPGYVRYNPTIGRTEFAYQNLKDKNRNNYNDHLLAALHGYNRDQMTTKPLVDATDRPQNWLDRRDRYYNDYNNLVDKAYNLQNTGNYEAAAKLLQEDIPAIRYEIQRLEDPRTAPTEFIYNPEPEPYPPQQTLEDDLGQESPRFDPYDLYLYQIGLENPGGPDPHQYPPEKNRNLYETYWDYDPNINYEEFVPPKHNKYYDPNAEFERPQDKYIGEGPAEE